MRRVGWGDGIAIPMGCKPTLSLGVSSSLGHLASAVRAAAGRDWGDAIACEVASLSRDDRGLVAARLPT